MLFRSKFGVKLPFDINCADIGTVPPFQTIAQAYQSAGVSGADGVKFNFYDAQVFDALFPYRSDAIVKMADFIKTPGSEAEYYYTCIDSFSLPSVLQQVQGLGIPIPPQAIQVIDVLNKLSVIFKKLNLTFRIEGAVVVGPRAIGATPTTLSNKFGSSV